MCRTLLFAAALSAAVLAPIWPKPLAAADRASVERTIEKTLDQPTRFEFVETPLVDVVDYLKEHHRLEIQFDNRSTLEAGLDPMETSITGSFKGISLRSALNRLLGDVDLTYVVEDEVLLITTPEAAAERVTTEVYPVADLVVSPDADEQQRRRRMLLTTITASIEPASWHAARGLGSIVYSEFRGGPVLVVTQSYSVHRRIGQLLDRQRAPILLRREAVAALRNSPPGRTVYRIGVTAAEEKAAEKIEGVLTQPTEFDFVVLPLTDVVDYLRKRHQVDIQIDRRALDDVGLDASTLPITQSAKGVTLRAGLRRLLDELYLTYLVRDEVLLITTPEEAQSLDEVRVYVVGDLMEVRLPLVKKPVFDSPGRVLGPPAAATAGPADQAVALSGATALAEILYPTVEPLTWDVYGGPGSIVACSVDGIDVLVVLQTAEVHDEIAQFLDRLREVISPEPPAAATAPATPLSEPSPPKETTPARPRNPFDPLGE